MTIMLGINFRFLFIIFVLLFSKLNVYAHCAITYGFSGGRLGDNLLTYAHAKWVSYKYNIPLLYKLFNLSQLLVIHKVELLYNNEINKYKATIRLDNLFRELKSDKNSIIKKGISNSELNNNFLLDYVFSNNKEEDVLYEIPYFPESKCELTNPEFSHAFQIDWNDQTFISILKENIRPLIVLPEFSIPKDFISLAVHVRRGSGPDLENMVAFKRITLDWPFKFVDDLFYIEMIKKVSELFNDEPLYVCIFTDYVNPWEIITTYKAKINKPNIIFDFKISKTNLEWINILDDFFTLTRFDCLIRSDSNFPIMASKLTRYKLQIAPYKVENLNGKIRIKEAIFENNNFEILIDKICYDEIKN